MQPDTIKDVQLPNLQVGIDVSQPVTTPTGTNANTPDQVPNVTPEQTIHASEVMSSALDTQSRTILAGFVFGQLGAIQIGNYVNGVSGQTVISPNGIVGTNKNGTNTFTIDGVTGDATFAGQIVGGTIVIGSGNNVFAVDANGNMWLGNASLASAPFQVSNSGGVTMTSWTLKTPNGASSIVGVNSGALGAGGGIFFPNDVGLYFADSSGGMHGAVFMGTDNNLYVGNNNSVKIVCGSVNAGLFDNSGDLIVYGNFAAGGTKSAIVNTKSGKRKLYALEAPEVWFFDFIEDPETQGPDPMFLEVTEGPIKSIRCEDGSVMIFRHRKGHASPRKRFQRVKRKQFMDKKK